MVLTLLYQSRFLQQLLHIWSIFSQICKIYTLLHRSKSKLLERILPHNPAACLHPFLRYTLPTLSKDSWSCICYSSGSVDSRRKFSNVSWCWRAARRTNAKLASQDYASYDNCANPGECPRTFEKHGELRGLRNRTSNDSTFLIFNFQS